MNCSWCQKPITAHGEAICGGAGKNYHQECASALASVAEAKRLMDEYEKQRRAMNPDGDPFDNEAGQLFLIKYRRLNRVALNKLTAENRLRLMFGQPLLPNSTLQ